MGGIIGTIIAGFITGILAKAVTPGPNPQGCLVTVALGIVGAFVGTWLGQQLGIYSEGERAGIIGGVIGAVIVLSVYAAVIRARR